MTEVQFVRYTTREDHTEENRRLVEDIFAELNSQDPGGLRNATFLLEDGRSFVHIAAIEDPATLANSAAFAEFVRGLGDRAVEPPQREGATLIGSYGLL